MTELNLEPIEWEWLVPIFAANVSCLVTTVFCFLQGHLACKQQCYLFILLSDLQNTGECDRNCGTTLSVTIQDSLNIYFLISFMKLKVVL